MWFVAACSGLVLGGLIESVFLARQGRVTAAKVVALSIVTLIYVWTCIECIALGWRILRARFKKEASQARARNEASEAQVRNKASRALRLFGGILTLSLFSMSCWGALREDDYKKFLAVRLFVDTAAGLY